VSDVKAERLSAITAPASAAWAVVAFYPDAVNTQKSWSNVNMNISDASKNGTYEAYWKETLELNLPTLTGKLDGEGESVVICPDGLRSAGTAFDEAVVENGMITKIVKRVASVDMGTIAWNTSSITNTYDTNFVRCFYHAKPSDMAAQTGTGKNQFLSDSFIAVNAQALTGDAGLATANKTMMYYPGGNLYARYDGITTAADFKTAVTGQTLYYELAEPQPYGLDTPIPVGYRVDGGGTERRLPADTASVVIAPFAAEISYAIDARGFIQNSTVNFISKESMTAFLEAMKTANIISAYTVTFDASTQKYTYTMTKVS
jgi:hypothetical protein